MTEPLIPEENPEFDPTATSLAGVSYKSVLNGLDQLYPPTDLAQRNALSRTDGYWPYISKGEEPPQQFTYGEFDFYFFAQLLDRVRQYYDDGSSQSQDWQDKIFVDIGSGTGRLALAAAALHPNMKKCRGVELLETIHQAALEKVSHCHQASDSGTGYRLPTTSDISMGLSLPMAPMEFVCGSFEDPYCYFGDADCVFVFSSCMSQELLTSLAAAIGRQCKPGTIVITTDYMLPLEGQIDPFEKDERVPWGSYKLSLLEKVDGWCWLTGGASTAFVYRVQQSLWSLERDGPLDPPEVTVEDKAYEVAKALESGELADPKSFLRGVYNNMAFHGIPESMRPKLDE